MRRGAKAADLEAHKGPMPVDEAARRLGLTKTELLELARCWINEPTYSVAEVALRWGCGVWAVHQLVRLGRTHGKQLHPRRGGLWPTFKALHKGRQIPLSAIERHEAFMEAKAA
jgi:hypothetical protein